MTTQTDESDSDSSHAENKESERDEKKSEEQKKKKTLRRSKQKCRFDVKQLDCPFGDECKFAHSKSSVGKHGDEVEEITTVESEEESENDNCMREAVDGVDGDDEAEASDDTEKGNVDNFDDIEEGDNASESDQSTVTVTIAGGEFVQTVPSHKTLTKILTKKTFQSRAKRGQSQMPRERKRCANNRVSSFFT